MQNKKYKIITTLLAGSFIWAASLTAQASEVVHSGINCEAANQAQASLMTWNKDGITNNSVLDLFVICPVDVDQNDWDATPQLNIEVTIWSPPGYGPDGATGPFCVARSGTPDTGTPPNDDQDFIATAFNVSTFQGDPVAGPGAVGDSDSASVTLINLNADDDRSAHLLCLLPGNGGTLQVYRGRQQ